MGKRKFPLFLSYNMAKEKIHINEVNNMLLAYNEVLEDDKKLFDPQVELSTYFGIFVNKRVLYHLIKNQKVNEI